MDEPTGPQQCRANAEDAIGRDDLPTAGVWALLAVAGELHEIRALLRKGR
ncbi:hypothetical protein [Actinocorallia longicatena]|uniref:Ankyrin repeat protein n=1 Tax=Actinocorallia longicatena TaxID=111803 RepID=A0ABP6QF84_9ACTN